MTGTGGPIAAATYMLPPMTRTAEVDALEAWIGDPGAAPRILVAEGRVQPKSALAWIIVRQWEKAGLVAIITEPGARGATCWVAERRVGAASPAGGAAAARRGGAASEPRTEDGELVSDVILRTIRRAANFGKPAPSLADLASAAELRSASNAAYYVQKLAARGRIGIETRAIIGGQRRRYQILDAQGVVVKQTEWGR